MQRLPGVESLERATRTPTAREALEVTKCTGLRNAAAAGAVACRRGSLVAVESVVVVHRRAWHSAGRRQRAHGSAGCSLQLSGSPPDSRATWLRCPRVVSHAHLCGGQPDRSIAIMRMSHAWMRMLLPPDVSLAAASEHARPGALGVACSYRVVDFWRRGQLSCSLPRRSRR